MIYYLISNEFFNKGVVTIKLIYDGSELSVTHPDIVKEWDFEKNYPLTPDDITRGSNIKVWWKCNTCGYEWITSPNKRTGEKTGCPKCAAKIRAKNKSLKAAKDNNFVEHFPDIAKEWNYEKNINLDISEYSSKSNIKVWWKCTFCGNEWEATINKRTSGRGCPNCSLFGTSFSEQVFFFYIKKLFPDAISRDKRFGCEFDIYIPSISTVVEYDGIFYHNSKKALDKENKKDEICFKNNIRMIRIRDPKLPNTAHAIRINCIDTQGVHLNNGVLELLELLKPNHSVLVNIDKDAIIIKTKFRNEFKENSIANKLPHLLEEWDYEKNCGLNPETISFGSKIKVWWKCKKCGYSWQNDPGHRKHGRDCPFCSNKVVVPGKNDLATLYPNLLEEWNYEKNGDFMPYSVTHGSNKKVWWKCKKCGYEWKASINPRTRGVGCPLCANKVIISGKNDFATLCPSLLKEWNYEKNINISPYEISRGSEKRVWWKCQDCGHEWEAYVYSRTAGRKCPICSHKRKGLIND